MTCTQCSHRLPNNAKFCPKCAAPVVTNFEIVCPSCQYSNDATANFCIQCRHALKSTQQTKSVIENGKWSRPPSEIVRKISPSEMSSAFAMLSSASKKSIEVPMGSICAVVENGKVVDILPPGRQTTQGWFEELMGQFGQSSSTGEFYFISRQSIAFPMQITTPLNNANGKQMSKVLVRGNIGHTFTNPKRITQFLEQFVGDKDSLSLQELQQQLHPQLKAAVEAHASGGSTKDIARTVENALSAIESHSGLQFSVQVTPTSSSQTISFHFGLVDVPSQIRCHKCNSEIQLGSRFCIKCRAPQTIRPSKASKTENIALISKDGQHIELDVSVLICGVKPLSSNDFAFGQDLALAIADTVRKYTILELVNLDSLDEVENKLAEKLSQSLAGHTVERCTVLDVRSQKEDWLFKTKADMEQVRLELAATKQWLSVGAEEQAIEQEVQEFIATRAAAQREESLIELATQLEFKRRQSALTTKDNHARTEASLSAAEAMFLLEQRQSDLQNEQAEHAGQQSVKEAERQHAVEQLLAGLKQDARLEQYNRETAYNKLLKAQQIEELLASRIAELEALEHTHRLEEKEQAQRHTLEATNQTHNLDMQGQQRSFARTESIKSAQTQSEIDSIRLQSEMSGLQARDELAAKQDQRRQAYEQKKREEARLDKAQDAQIAQDLLKAKQTHELAKMASRQRLVAALDGKSVSQIMALAAVGEGRALTDAEAQSISKIESGEDAARANALADFIEEHGTDKANMLGFFQSIVGDMAKATANAVRQQNAPSNLGASTCSHCGTSNPAGSQFCQECGQDI